MCCFERCVDRRGNHLLTTRLWQLYQEVEKTEDIAFLEEGFDKSRPEWELYLQIMALIDAEREELLGKIAQLLQGDTPPADKELTLRNRE